MESDEEEEYTLQGPVDDEGFPHGHCTLAYTSGDKFEGHLDHGAKSGKGCFHFYDGSKLEGVFDGGMLQGKGLYTYEDGSVLKGIYVDGELNGPAEEFNSEGQLTFRGQYSNGVKCGFCWIYSADGGCICGDVNDEGEMSGKDIAYIYPDMKLALIGSFVDGEMVKGKLAEVVGIDQDRPQFKMVSDGGIFKCDVSTSNSISSDLQLPDPYEQQMVYVGASTIQGASEGLFMKVPVKEDKVVAFYNGLRLTHAEVDARDWSKNGNTISLDEEIVIDVPPPFDDTKHYCASLGHKVNHSFSPNSKYDLFQHPRFGFIKCIRTMKPVSADEELTVEYGYDHHGCGVDNPDAPDWYKEQMKSLKGKN
ncbi:SETD7 [Branchiostoma lanceolatum]|uniref:Histone-lysine N-methyltransferase SETD7 n=1 Tax=Branchiostoma lanceolatum TaxID=7740 RepID=A0A8K0EC33_BRALA|nr:SETD7 [Branchiostoma lanceolatum]